MGLEGWRTWEVGRLRRPVTSSAPLWGDAKCHEDGWCKVLGGGATAVI